MFNAVASFDHPAGSSTASFTVALLVACALVATLFLSYVHLAGH